MDPPSPGLGPNIRRRVAVACLFNLLFATPPPPPSKRKLIDDDDDFLSDRRHDDDDFLSELVRAYEVVRKSSGRIRPLYRERERCLLLGAKGFGLEFRPRLVCDDSA